MNADEYFSLLNAHDWTYSYSDDHSIWRRGENNDKKLRMLHHNNKEFKELYTKFHDFYVYNKGERPTLEVQATGTAVGRANFKKG